MECLHTLVEEPSSPANTLVISELNFTLVWRDGGTTTMLTKRTSPHVSMRHTPTMSKTLQDRCLIILNGIDRRTAGDALYHAAEVQLQQVAIVRRTRDLAMASGKHEGLIT